MYGVLVRRHAVVTLTSVMLAPLTVGARDWPTYGHDAARSGISEEQLTFPLGEKWVFQPSHPPSPAWAPPQPKPVEGIQELPRSRFDAAFQVAVAQGKVFFGSSSDHIVYALDLDSGKLEWRFVTSGPVRLAPTWWQGKVFVGSDDGIVYALEASSGKLVWKRRAGPSDDRLLGNGRFVSMWPVRTGVLVDEGVAFFGAGVFPAEGLFLYAVGAEDGSVIWQNDSFGEGGLREISPQGYLLASGDKVFMTTGRSVPAAFDRRDGRFLFQRGVNRFREGTYGGTDAVLAGNHVFSGTEQILTFDTASGAAGHAWFHGRRLVVTEDTFYLATLEELAALDRDAFPPASRRRQELKHRRLDLTSASKSASAQLDAVQRRLEAAQTTLRALEERRAAAPTNQQVAEELGKARMAARAIEKEHEDATAAARKVEAQLADLREAEDAVAGALRAATRWRVRRACPDALILAGTTLLAGGAGSVVAVDATSGRIAWEGNVPGRASGLAVADGHVLVSSETGAIHCFGNPPPRSATIVNATGEAPPREENSPEAARGRIARQILEDSAVGRGYALVLGSDMADIGVEIARHSDLMVYVVEPDPKRLPAARQAAIAEGLYGARVSVEEGSLEKLPFSDYFANLIVCDASHTAGVVPTPAREVLRMLKPMGGVAYAGLPGGGSTGGKSPTTDGLWRWLSDLDEEESIVSRKVHEGPGGAWARIERGALPGAGSWTHQYAEPGNTAASDDELVRGPLGLLWYGDPGPTRMVNRHASAAAPVATGGRLFVQGENVLMAYDAYNGLLLWEREIPGAMRTGLKLESSNLVASDDSLFVAVGESCLRIAQRTGEMVREYDLPPAGDGRPRRWGYVACADGVLVGSRTVEGRVADGIFALDPDTGERLWVLNGGQILHPTIAITDGQVHFVDLEVTEAQEEAVERHGAGKPRLDRRGRPVVDARRVVALGLKSGKTLWERTLDFSDSVKISRGGGELAAIAAQGILLLFTAPWNGHFWQEFFAGEFSRRSLTALSVRTGDLVWTGNVGYRSRPLVVGGTIIAEPWARELTTGRPRMRADPITGKEQPWQMARPGHHCGCIAASASCLFFRSGSVGYYDLAADFGTAHFGGIRPGCWINFIAANGVLLVPEGSSGCVCPFPIQCTIAFKHRESDRSWGLYSSSGALSPVSRLGVNLGAPGDRKDSADTLWLAFPRPRRDRLVLDLPVEVTTAPRGRYIRQDADITPSDDESKRWVLESGCAGIRRLTIPLVGEGDAAGTYTVRLYFAELEEVEPGERVFDVALQGAVVLEDLDIARLAQDGEKAVAREIHGVEVTGRLEISLDPKPAASGSGRPPILSGVEVRRTGMRSASADLPAFVLDDVTRERTGEAVVRYAADDDFEGVLEIGVPQGFAVEPDRLDVSLGPRSVKRLELKVALSGTPAVGDHELHLRLLSESGDVELEATAPLRYTGRRGEVVIPAQADCFVRKKDPRDNFGDAETLWCDGGDQELGDGDHAIVYYRFRLDVPGKPLAATARFPVSAAEWSESGDAGVVHVVEAPWTEGAVTYESRPELGPQVGRLGSVAYKEVVERPLTLDFAGRKEVTLALVPTSCDGAGFWSREGERAAELIVEYELAPPPEE